MVVLDVGQGCVWSYLRGGWLCARFCTVSDSTSLFYSIIFVEPLAEAYVPSGLVIRTLTPSNFRIPRKHGHHDTIIPVLFILSAQRPIVAGSSYGLVYNEQYPPLMII